MVRTGGVAPLTYKPAGCTSVPSPIRRAGPRSGTHGGDGRRGAAHLQTGWMRARALHHDTPPWALAFASETRGSLPRARNGVVPDPDPVPMVGTGGGAPLGYGPAGCTSVPFTTTPHHRFRLPPERRGEGGPARRVKMTTGPGRLPAWPSFAAWRERRFARWLAEEVQPDDRYHVIPADVVGEVVADGVYDLVPVYPAVVVGVVLVAQRTQA